MMKRIYISTLILLLGIFSYGQKQDGSVLFQFKYHEGDKYRILSTVDEDVLVNRRLDHRTKIVNRISVEVGKVAEDGSAEHSATFMASESAVGTYSGGSFSWGEEYHSEFTRSPRGIYKIKDEFFMPVVRDVPVFPDRPLKPGDTWEAQGHEAHDLRGAFGVDAPFKVPFTAQYKYAGLTKDKDSAGKLRDFHEFSVEYKLYFKSPSVPRSMQAGEYPAETSGYSKQKIFWDAEKGAIDHYGETFSIKIATSRGNVFEFRGTARAEVTEFTSTATDENVLEIQSQIEELGVENVSVKKEELGLTLSVENIQFASDSSILRESEREKLRRLAKIIAAYPNNDLLVSGHTALAGSRETCQALSEERAKAVARFLASIGAKEADRIFTQGFGADKPIGDNNTDEGRAQNRRVEITILDK